MEDSGRCDSSVLQLTIGVPGLISSSGSGGGNGSAGCMNMRDLDMNQPALGWEEDEYYPIGSTEEEEEEEVEGAASAINPRSKKLRLSKEQSRLLEESFRLQHTLNPKEKAALAMKLKLRARQVEVWFQNRRARTKLKQTEVECEYLKRCFSSLTEENRRLQREVEELRALRVAPPTAISPHNCQPMLASALTMCPRCERVSTAATFGLSAAPGISMRAAAVFSPFQPSTA